MKPFINYRFSSFMFGSWGEDYKAYPVGTSFDEVRKDMGIENPANWRTTKLEWESWAWPGGYPIYYVTKDCGILCPKCANDNLAATLNDDPQWQIVAMDTNDEDQHMYCGHCNTHMEPSCGFDTIEGEQDV